MIDQLIGKTCITSNTISMMIMCKSNNDNILIIKAMLRLMIILSNPIHYNS